MLAAKQNKMSKIKTITITNFKAVDMFTADFNGCTAIVTAGNNKGKTSLLRGITDRIRGIKPELIVKQGEESGKGELVLTDGCRFVWEFDAKGKEKLTFFTKENIKSAVTREIAARYFPPTFDIDKFLQSQPKQQAAQLQQAFGIDCTDVDARYKKAYAERTTANADYDREKSRLESMGKPEKVEPVTLDVLTAKKEQLRNELNAEYSKNVAHNKEVEAQWKEECSRINSEKSEYEKTVANVAHEREIIGGAISQLMAFGYGGTDELYKWRDTAYQLPQAKVFNIPAEPEYKDPMPDRSELDKIDAEILSASDTNVKANSYKQYLEQVKNVDELKRKAEDADGVVKAIEQERKDLIASAKLPDGVMITDDGITVNGLPLDKTQLSTSKLYITALQFGAMNLGEVKSLYFDASYLDRNSLSEIQDWAQKNDLQLLIERPDFDGGDIQYQLIES